MEGGYWFWQCFKNLIFSESAKALTLLLLLGLIFNTQRGISLYFDRKPYT